MFTLAHMLWVPALIVVVVSLVATLNEVTLFRVIILVVSSLVAFWALYASQEKYGHSNES